MRLTAQALVVFRVSSTGVNHGIQFKPEEWQVFSRADGKRTVADIAQQLGLDPNIVWHTAKSLYNMGVLEPAEGYQVPSEIVGEKFFPILCNEFRRVMGAISEIILDEELGAMGEARERFPKDRAPELVERISQSIRNEQKRLLFQQAMLTWLLREQDKS